LPCHSHIKYPFSSSSSFSVISIKLSFFFLKLLSGSKASGYSRRFLYHYRIIAFLVSSPCNKEYNRNSKPFAVCTSLSLLHPSLLCLNLPLVLRCPVFSSKYALMLCGDFPLFQNPGYLYEFFYVRGFLRLQNTFSLLFQQKILENPLKAVSPFFQGSFLNNAPFILTTLSYSDIPSVFA